MTSKEIATIIYDRLSTEKEHLASIYRNSEKGIGYFYIDDLLPESLANEISNTFPEKEDMVLKKSLREFKHVAAQMDQYNPLLEKVIYAFQDERVVSIIGKICQIDQLEPDEFLYAGGLSLMAEDNFLNPHLDNSHDKDRDKWRVLNLLYYVTPDWKENYGGHLEIWPNGIKEEQTTLYSNFNRLVVMATHQSSWHSVSPVLVDGERCCVSNYYFSNNPLREEDRFHVTTFRARPGQKIKNLVLSFDSFLRMNIRKIFRQGIKKNPHVYKKDGTK